MIVLQKELKSIKSDYVSSAQFQDIKKVFDNLKQTSLVYNQYNYSHSAKEGTAIILSKPESSTLDTYSSLQYKTSTTSAESATTNIAVNPASLFRDKLMSQPHEATTVAAERLMSKGESKQMLGDPFAWKTIIKKKLINSFSRRGRADTGPHGKFKAAAIKIPIFMSNVLIDTNESNIVEYIRYRNHKDII